MIVRYSRPYALGALFVFILLTGTYLLMIPTETSEYLRSYLNIKHNATTTHQTNASLSTAPNDHLSDQKTLPDAHTPPTKMLVVASTKDSNVTWVDEVDWEHTILRPDPPLKNKGREANMYLAYIIDNYDNLRDITAFMHGHKTAWHIDAPKKANTEMLSHLRLNYVQQEGYVSFRCGNIPGGCNEFMRPFETNETTMANWPKAYEAMFNEPAPKIVASPCCAQFAVTRSHILKRSKEDYKRYHKWLMDTDLPDHNSGRIFEFLWHIMFGKDSVLCPSTKACWCNMYGWCKEGTFFG